MLLLINSEISGVMVNILNDMEILLASDRRFLLGNWLESAKSIATNSHERDYYEWNARSQVSIWGQSYTVRVSYKSHLYKFVFLFIYLLHSSSTMLAKLGQA